MRLVKANKYHKCKNHCDIWPGTYYYPQRRKKALCLKCGYSRKPKKVTFIVKLLNWLGAHGEQKAKM